MEILLRASDTNIERLLFQIMNSGEELLRLADKNEKNGSKDQSC